MLAKSLTLAVLTAATAVAALDAMTPVRPPTPPGLERRQLGCGITQEVCGDGCIPITYTCCPSGAGGCPLTSTCEMGTNGEYGCCPIGKNCVGAGGVSTIGDDSPRPAPTPIGGDDDDDIDFVPQPKPTGSGSGSGIGGGIGSDDDDDDKGDSGSGFGSGSDSGSGIGGDRVEPTRAVPTFAALPTSVEDLPIGAGSRAVWSFAGAVGALMVAL